MRKIAKTLLKQHCYCPMLLMRTTKTAVCLQNKVIFHLFYPTYIDPVITRPKVGKPSRYCEGGATVDVGVVSGTLISCRV